MCPERFSAARSRGFLIPSAIFLLVILSGLAAVLVTISSSQHLGSAQDVGGARAYQAARSGLEWGFYQTLVPTTAVCSPKQDVPLDQTAFPGLGLTVNCLLDPDPVESEGGVAVTLYKITATACSPFNAAAPACPYATPGPLYVERRLEAVVER